MNFDKQAQCERITLIVINPTQAQLSNVPSIDDSNVITSGIYSGSIHLTQSLVEQELVFGNVSSSMFEIKLSTDEGVEGDEIAIWQTLSSSDENVSKLLFYGVITSSKLDKNAYYRDIVAYDKLSVIFDTDVAGWYNSLYEDNDTKSVYELRTSLLNYLGLTEENVSLPNDDIDLPVAMEVSSIKAVDVFKNIGEIQGFIPYFTNKVEYYTFNGAERDITNEIRGNESTFEDYTTIPISGVKILQSTDTTVASSGTDDNYYSVVDNILLSVLTSTTLNTVANNLYDAIKGISYTPMNARLKYTDININLGDKIIINDKTSYVLGIELGGSQLISEDVKCDGNKSLIENNKKSLEPVYVLLNNRLVKVEIDANHIDFLIRENEETSELELTPEGIKLIGDSITISSKNIVLDGDTTVNSGFVLSADNINVNSLFAENIEATGTITGATLKGADIEAVNGNIGGFSILSQKSLQYIGDEDVEIVIKSNDENNNIVIKKGELTCFDGRGLYNAGITKNGITYTQGQIARHTIGSNVSFNTNGTFTANAESGIELGGNTNIDGNITASGKANITGGIELVTKTEHTTGGFIDFHFRGSTADYTSRLVEDQSGRLKVSGKLATGGDTAIGGDLYITGTNPVGTILTATPSSAVSLASGTGKNITSKALTKGKWMVKGCVRYPNNSSGYRCASLTTTSNNNSVSETYSVVTPTVSGAISLVEVTKIFDITADSTTIYLVGKQNSGTSLSCLGYIEAIKIV